MITYDISRLSRDNVDTNTLVALFRKYNVNLKCLNNRSETETASDRFALNLTAVNNSYEREKVIERTNFGLLAIAEAGKYPCGGKPPYGYHRNEQKNLVVDESQTSVIRLIFDLAGNHMSSPDIVSTVNAENPDRRISGEFITKVLAERRYLGEFRFKNHVYRNIIPRIVDDELFEMASAHVRRKPAKDNEEYIFDELVWCDICGSKMTCYSARNRKNEKYFYYHCRNCEANISQKQLDAVFRERTIVTDEAAADRTRKLLHREETALNRCIRKIKQRYVEETIDETEYFVLSMPLVERLNEIHIRMQVEEGGDKDMEYSMIEDKKLRKEYIQTRVKSITVNPKAKKILNVEYTFNVRGV